jgi:hypothetical protein
MLALLFLILVLARASVTAEMPPGPFNLIISSEDPIYDGKYLQACRPNLRELCITNLSAADRFHVTLYRQIRGQYTVTVQGNGNGGYHSFSIHIDDALRDGYARLDSAISGTKFRFHGQRLQLVWVPGLHSTSGWAVCSGAGGKLQWFSGSYNDPAGCSRIELIWSIDKIPPPTLKTSGSQRFRGPWWSALVHFWRRQRCYAGHKL